MGDRHTTMSPDSCLARKLCVLLCFFETLCTQAGLSEKYSQGEYTVYMLYNYICVYLLQHAVPCVENRYHAIC